MIAKRTQGGPTPPEGAVLERVWAWGMASSAESWVYRPDSVEGVRRALAHAREAGLSVGLRGAGQSYGDAALNAGNVCLDLSRMDRVLAWDPDAGVINVEPGVTIRQLWRHTIEDGWWPFVVPGTMAVSLGGAAAMNVHGKNNWKVGPIGDHIVDLDLLLPGGDIVRCSRDEHAELFHAVIGGFGMLGCIVGLRLRLERIHSGLMRIEPIPVRSFDEMAAMFEERRGRADYLVGWCDTFAAGAATGRGLIHQANHLAPGEDPDPATSLRPQNQELPGTLLGVLPKSLVWRFMRPLTNDPGVRLVNAAKYHLSRLQGRRTYQQSHVGFAFLFDYVPGWKRAYGPHGLIQFQSFVPAGTAVRTFRALLDRSHEAGIVPYLSVFKRHRPDPFLMTHALDGYSLAMDFKVTARNRRALWALAAELAALVVDAGGRFYFAKDSTLVPQSLRAYLAEDRVRRFLALKQGYDPEGLLQTDLYRRIFTDGGA